MAIAASISGGVAAVAALALASARWGAVTPIDPGTAVLSSAFVAPASPSLPSRPVAPAPASPAGAWLDEIGGAGYAITAAPFWKYAARGPLLGTPVTAAPFVRYWRAASSMSVWLGAFPAAASCIM